MSATVYLNYFGLREPPFSITPDPRYMYLSPRHEDALAHLLYGVGQGGSGGFIQLTGEVGTGKTTLCRTLLEQTPEGVQVALILNPIVTPEELVAGICDELRIPAARQGSSLKSRVDALNHYLLEAHARGERVVVVIDEAQNLSVEALEQVRLLTNLETHQAKLLQIILLGQPELRDLLGQSQLRQLAQRITARFHLTPLNESETAAYIRHRMAVAASGSNPNPFTADAMRRLHRLAGGVPRLINIIADRALTAAYAQDSRTINPKLVSAAAAEVQGETPRGLSWSRMHSKVALIGTATAASVLALVLAWPALSGRLPAGPDIPAMPGSPVELQAVPTAAPDLPSEPEFQVTENADPAADQSPEPGPPVVDENWWQDSSLQAFAAMARVWQPWSEHAVAQGQAEQSASGTEDSNTKAAIPELTEQLAAACRLGRHAGFACVELSGNWQRIRRLGLPVMLRLSLPAGGSISDQGRWLAVVGMSASHVQIATADAEVIIPRDAVEALWLGDYAVIWPQSPEWPRALREGHEDEAVSTVKALAARQPNGFSGAVNEIYGADFADWVETFQSRHGLHRDGIVGDATMLHLLAPEIDQPRLELELEDANQINP